MRTHLLFTVASVTTLSVAALAACGSDATPAGGPGTTPAPAAAGGATSASAALPGAVIKYTGDFASPYCTTARDWAAHELVEHDWSEPPASNEAYWSEYTAFVETAHPQAPADITADWGVYVAGKEALGAVFVKYGFDGQRFEAEATEAERAIVGGPSGDLQAAIDNVLRYEAEVCRTDFHGAADIAYRGDSNSEYCKLLNDYPAATLPPAELEAAFTGDAGTKLADDVIAATPPEIKAEQEMISRWDQEHLPKILSAHGWDFRRVLRKGTEEELVSVFHATPELRDADARQTAYSEQVCQ